MNGSFSFCIYCPAADCVKYLSVVKYLMNFMAMIVLLLLCVKMQTRTWQTWHWVWTIAGDPWLVLCRSVCRHFVMWMIFVCPLYNYAVIKRTECSQYFASFTVFCINKLFFYKSLFSCCLICCSRLQYLSWIRCNMVFLCAVILSHMIIV